ncbi:MAG TPA: SCO family protein [Gammaproteobacteria bacterium]|nr:SCO family protein [Gammaproteobacteria bacterium]
MNKSSIAAVAILALVVGFSLSWYLAHKQPVKLESGTWFGDKARPLPDFELIGQDGRKMTRESLRGKWSLMFFGFTHCPDICPTTLQTLAQMMQQIDDPDVAAAVQVIFVSVDPERDTPQILRDYVTYFDPGFIGATAPMEKLRQLTRPLGIAHEIRNRIGNSMDYDVDHSAAIVLVNPAAEFAGLFGAPQNAAAMARDMTRIVEHN